MVNHAPAAFGLQKTLYNRWMRWSRMGVLFAFMAELAVQTQDIGILMFGATHKKAHWAAASLAVQKGGEGV